jgi:O-antigen/teichoic acid export membrane protein
MSSEPANMGTRVFGRIYRRFEASQPARQVTLLTGATLVAQGIVLATAPILTRIYAPEEFGTLAVFLGIVGILTVVATLSYDMAIPLPARDSEGFAIVLLTLLIVAIVTLLTCGSPWLLRTSFFNAIVPPALIQYAWLLPIGLGFTALYQVFQYWAIRKKTFGRVAGTTIQQSAVAVGIQLAASSLGAAGLLLGQILGKAFSAITLVVTTFRKQQNRDVTLDGRTVLRMARRYRRFPQYSCFSALVNAGGTHLPVVLFAACYGPFMAGQLALVQRVVSLPMVLVGRAVSQVYFSEIASLRHESSANIRTLFFRVTRHLATASALLLTTLAITAPWLFPTVFGASWSPAGRFASILAPAAATRLVAAPISQTLNVLERQNWQLGWDLGRLALIITSILVTARMGWSPEWNVAAYSAALCVAYVTLWSLSFLGINHAA